ncbi:MAG: diphthamide synthesis protein [Candidatus Altiarchaeota archaeon]
MKILFIPCYSKKKIFLNEKILKKIEKYERVALFTTTQHLAQLSKVKKFLQSKGKKVVAFGQILGCSFGKIEKVKNKVDVFIYIGSGKFHALGISARTEKPVIIFNPYTNSIDEISDDERKKYIARKKAAILKALSAKVFGILVSTKTNQFNFKKAIEIKKQIEKKGRKAFIFVGDEISPEKLLGFKVDLWLNTACPRISEDYFDKPIINLHDFSFDIL